MTFQSHLAHSLSKTSMSEPVGFPRTGMRLSRRVSLTACLALLVVLTLSATSAQATEGCPNEGVRREQASTGLGGCRAYERVSPEEKGQGDIVGDGLTTIAALDGEAVAFNSRTPFGDTIGSGVSGQTQYVARRGATGWTAHAVTPTPRPDAVQTFAAATKLQTFSDDLRTAVLWAYDLPAVTGDAVRRNSIYQEDTATRALRTITVSQAAPLAPADFLTQEVWGISADAKHVVFVTPTQMLPEAALGVPNVYQWDDGVLSLAGVLPDGSVPKTGSDVVDSNPFTLTTYRRALSEDGTRLAFTAASPSGGANQVYLRIGNHRTVWVSQPEGSDQSDPANVALQAMTPDGHNVFFVTDSALLDSDTNSGPDIYRYTDSADPASDRGNLTLVTNRGDLVSNSDSGAALVGVSDDGKRVYYHTINGTLGVWDDSGATPVTRVISSDVPRDSNPERQLTVLASTPGLARVTPDGGYLAFVSDVTLGGDGVHGVTGEVTNGHPEMYVYSLSDESLSCVSCPSGAATGDTVVTPATTSGPVQVEDVGIRPRFLSDGGRVFFSTPESLVAQDRNGVYDTYEYDAAGGGLSLLSTGTGSNPTTFADASASGDDVFLTTRQRLVRSDHDDLVDMYDVRVGGGFPEPASAPPPACVGDDCQGSLGGAPLFETPSSLSVAGVGNLKPAVPRVTVRSLTAAQKLAGALKKCRSKHRKRVQRKRCEVSARKSFRRSK